MKENMATCYQISGKENRTAKQCTLRQKILKSNCAN